MVVKMRISWSLLLITLYLLKCSYTNLPSTSRELELVAVAVLFRHGDRAPLNSFPSDPYFQKVFWPMGFGQLTPNGIRRAYSLGQWFREWYGGFLDQLYKPEEIYVWSTDVDRTLSTAQTVLAGLYPPKCFQLWNEDLRWQPIPVHTANRRKDVVNVEKRSCPKHKKLWYISRKLKYSAIEKEHEELINHLREFTGWKRVTLDEIQIFRNQLYVFENYNVTFIPDWSININRQELDYLADVPFQIPSSTKTLARLRQGPFFHRLFSNFEKIISTPKSGPKFFIFSCHDTCLVSALDAMGIYDFRSIGFTDTLIWELRKSKDCNFFLNINYKHQVENKKLLEGLKLDNCDIDCPYTKFKEIMKEVTLSIDDWVKECHEDESLTSVVSRLSQSR